MFQGFRKFRAAPTTKHAVKDLVKKRPVVETVPQIHPHVLPVGLRPLTPDVVVLETHTREKTTRLTRRTGTKIRGVCSRMYLATRRWVRRSRPRVTKRIRTMRRITCILF